MNYDLYNNNVNNSNSNNNNVHNIKNIKSESKDDICSSVPENVGIKNLVGLTDKLLNHMKRRINNIFSKMKIPIFNIEDYTINRKLGEGSYGIIFSVNKQNQKSPMYALKKIVAKTITEVSDFIKEFELVYLCDHPNIMKIYGICLRILDTTTFAIYVLMEKSKYDWNKEIKFYLSKRKTYSEKELINILKQLTEALLYLKNKLNISHRDIKPQNILIFDDGMYKLADFGEAKEVKISKKLNTLRGTELYMSPALYEGLKRDKNDVSHDPFKSDVFSLGFCFLVAAGLNFNLLYQVRDLTDNNAIEKAINTNLGKMYSHTFIEILCKMLQVDETKRFGFTEILDYLNSNYK
jgi:serine/threonine protein kinase